MNFSAVIRFLSATLLLAVALLLLFLNNSGSGILLSLLLSMASYYLYTGADSLRNFWSVIRKNGKWDLLFDLFILAGAALVFNVFRTSSNIEFFFNQQGDLYVQNQDGNWSNLDAFEQELYTEQEYENSQTTVYSLPVKRVPETFLQRIESYLNPNRLMIFEFSPQNEFLIFADTPGLQSINAQKAMEESSSNFVINSNFYGSDNNMLGELIIEGKRYGNQSRDATGFFRVIKGVPYVGAKSVLNSIPGKLQYSCQAMPSVIKNGDIFSYISRESGPYKPSWGRKTYRNLVGKKKNGNLVFIASNNGALLSVKEISAIAKLYGVHNASLFDGGAALQYRFKNPDYELSFSTFNNFLSFGERVDAFIMKRYKINFSSRSPVYICVKENSETN